MTRTRGLPRRSARVWASWVPTTAHRAIVVERRAVPGVKRPNSQADVAPSVVVRARCRILLISGAPRSEVPRGSVPSGPAPDTGPVSAPSVSSVRSVSSCSFGVTATAIAGNRSVNRFTSSI